jgi:uncharacterized membrane protein YidH (DUF202 family)
MSEPIRYRCAITASFLDEVEPQLRAAMLSRHDRVVPERRARQRPLLAVLRLAGLGLTALGIGLAGYAIAFTPDAPCTRSTLVISHLAMVFFVIAGTVFWFMPPISARLGAWVRRVVERRAPQVLARLRTRAPYAVEYAIGRGRIEARAEELGLVRGTDLRTVGAAVVAPRVACLYRGRRSTWLRRVVYLPDADARRAVVEALRGAGCEVTEVAGA